MAKANKKSVKKISIIVLCSILIATILTVSIIAILNATAVSYNKKRSLSFDKVVIQNQLVPTKQEGVYTFTTDSDFKIMQLTDIHIGAGIGSKKLDAMAFNAIAAMITYEKPDLVVVTGDIAFPVPAALNFNNKICHTMFADFMENLGVYWTATFGNHDSESYNTYRRNKVADLYASDTYKYCLLTNDEKDIDGEGNHYINIKNSKNIITQTLYMIDSNAYAKGGGYDNIHQNQIDWYKRMVVKNNNINKAILDSTTDAEILANKANYQVVKSLAFFHIPMTEYKTALQEYVANGNKDTADTKYHYGVIKEPDPFVCCPKTDDNMFEAMLEAQSTKGVFVGHDHVNNMSLTYKGIRLNYSMSIDYFAYKNIDEVGEQRGCTIINIKSSGDFDCHLENYYQAKYATKYTKETVKDM